MTETRKLRVFLCHSSQDKPIVRELYQRLNAEGWIDPWLDEEKLLPGQDWDMEIEKAVEAADTVIVCLSNNSVNKEGYIQKEIRKVLDISEEKIEGTIFIIPLRLEDCEPPHRLKPWQYTDYFPDDQKERSYRRLVQALITRKEEQFRKVFAPANRHNYDVTQVEGMESSKLTVGGRDYFSFNIENHLTYFPEINSVHQLPSPPADFSGRKNELDVLVEAILQKGIRIVAITGMGGVGKTSLGLKLAETLTRYFSDSQIFLNLRGFDDKNPLTPEQVMKYVVRSYHPKLDIPDNELEGIYRSILVGRKVLLFFDNVNLVTQVQTLLPPKNCILIITSRRRMVLPDAHEIELGILPDEEAISLIRNIEPNKIGNKDHELLRLCGNLPLALRLVVSYLRERKDITITDLLEQLNDPLRSLSLTGFESSIQLSYDALTSNLKKKWGLLSIFPGSFTRDSVYAVWNEGGSIGQDNLSELVCLGLVDFDTKNHRYILHDLLRAFGKIVLNREDEFAGMERFSQYYLSALRNANAYYIEGKFSESAVYFETEKENIKSGKSWATLNSHNSESSAVLSCEYFYAGRTVLYLNLAKNESQEWIKDGLEAAQLLGNKKWECFYLIQIGSDKQKMFASEAQSIYQKALSLARQIGNTEFEADILDGLGLVYYSMTNLDLAIKHHEEAIDIAHKANYKIREGGATINLGVLYEKTGDSNKALEMIQTGINILRSSNRIHSFESIGLERIGDIYLEQRRFEQAKEYYFQSLEVAEKIGNYSRISSVLRDLNKLCAKTGDIGLAIDYGEKALAASKKNKSGDISGEEFCLFNLARIYSDSGDRDKAIRHFEDALALARKINSPTRIGVRLYYLGFEYRLKSEYHRALELYNEALQISRQTKDYKMEIVTLVYIGAAYQLLNDRLNAVGFYEQALDIIGKVDDPDFKDFPNLFRDEIAKIKNK